MKRTELILAGLAATLLAGCSVEVSGNSSVTFTNEVTAADNGVVETITDDDAMANATDGDAMANAADGDAMDAGDAMAEGNSQ